MHEAYDNYSKGVSQALNVYDSFLTEIEITTKEEVSKTGIDIEINNNGTENIKPVVNFSNIFAVTNTVLIDGITRVKTLEELDVNDLILDFENQIYTADGVNIIDKLEFMDNKPFYISENEVNNITLSNEGTITYYKYPDRVRERYVQNFRVDGSFEFDDNNKRLIDKEFSFNLSQYKTSDRSLLGDIQQGKTFRFKIVDTDIEDYNTDTSYLLECKITDWEYNFNQQGDLILTNISGEAKDFIKRGVNVSVTLFGMAGTTY